MIVLLFTVGCNAFLRQDYHGTFDDTLSLQTIGFLERDNTSLTRDCVATVSAEMDDIYIVIPYDFNISQELTVSFQVKSSLAQVGIPSATNNSITGSPWVSGSSRIKFNTPQETKNIRLVMDHPVTNEKLNRDYTLHIKKIIQVKLLNKNISQIPGGSNPVLQFQIVDENGDPIPNQDEGTWMPEATVPIWHTDLSLFFDQYPPDFSTTDNAFLLEISPRRTGFSEIFLPNGFYVDKEGNKTESSDIHPVGDSLGALLRINYTAPVLHLSYNGDDLNDGLTANTPVKTWSRAIEIAANEGIQFLKAVASDSNPYDVAGKGEIEYSGSGTPWFNISGGWSPDFSTQYTPANSGYQETIFYDSTQTSGSGGTGLSSVFSFRSTMSPPISLLLSSITVEASSKDISDSSALIISNPSGDTSKTISLNQVVCLGASGSGTHNSAMAILDSANVDIRESTITGGSASSSSKGIYVYNIHKAVIDNSEIYSGTASSGNSIGLEIINAASSNFSITESQIESGMASGSAYGIYSEDGTLKIDNSTIIAKGTGGSGYGIYSKNTAITINNNTIELTGTGKSKVEGAQWSRGFTSGKHIIEIIFPIHLRG
ncbi:MAG: hypothetical protein B0D92_07455, partial [Spirochaeta sp. LUC14_002_19_P3]